MALEKPSVNYRGVVTVRVFFHAEGANRLEFFESGDITAGTTFVRSPRVSRVITAVPTKFPGYEATHESSYIMCVNNGDAAVHITNGEGGPVFGIARPKSVFGPVRLHKDFRDIWCQTVSGSAQCEFLYMRD